MPSFRQKSWASLLALRLLMVAVLLLYPRQLPAPSPNIYSQQEEHFHGNQCTVCIQDLHYFFGLSSNFVEGPTWQSCHLLGVCVVEGNFLWATYTQSVRLQTSFHFVLETVL